MIKRIILGLICFLFFMFAELYVSSELIYIMLSLPSIVFIILLFL